MRLHHVQVSCPRGGEDLALAFYGGVLGLSEVGKPPGLAARGGVWFRGHARADRTYAGEVHVGVEEPFVPARKAHPALLVDELDDLGALAAACERAGHPVAWDQGLSGCRRFYTADGHGNRVELLAAA